MGAAGKGKKVTVEAQITRHGLARLIRPIHDCGLIVLGGGQDASAGEQEDGGQTGQHEVDDKATVPSEKADAVY